MPVLLTTSHHLPESIRYDVWCGIGAIHRSPESENWSEAIAGGLLEAKFDQGREPWRRLARHLAEEETATLAHLPSCAANVSDMGLMIAWTSIIREQTDAAERLLVVCDDPWLFRHILEFPVTPLCAPPSLLSAEISLALRGAVARLRYSLGAVVSVLRFRHMAKRMPRGASALISYAHPASDAQGGDAYFGNLMDAIPGLRRVLHVDSGPGLVLSLVRDGRTAPLSAWGGLADAFKLVRAFWRPRLGSVPQGFRWLVRRAAALEGGTAQGAAIRWQQLCQARFLDQAAPARIVWPWENHGWERHLVRIARSRRVATVGYQHATVGRREWNYAPANTSDLPDNILCAGRIWRDTLIALGVPAERIAVAGTLRAMTKGPLPRDPGGPVFFALPFDRALASEMISAARDLASSGRRVLVRDHPKASRSLNIEPPLERANSPLSAQTGLDAVVYCASTVGLEAILAGLPVVRYVPRSTVVMDVLPPGLDVPTAASGDMSKVLETAAVFPSPSADSVFAPADWAVWRQALGLVDGKEKVGTVAPVSRCGEGNPR